MRNPFKRQPRPIDKPTLKQRAAALKATAARLIRKPASSSPASEDVDWHNPPPGFMAFPAIEPTHFFNIRYGIAAELERLRDIARVEYARREPYFRDASFTEEEIEARLSALRDELRLSALDAAIADPKALREDDAELIALGRAFDAAAARAQEADDAHGADRDSNEKRIAADKAAEPAYALAEQIAPLPVHTLTGMHVKLRLAAFYWTCLPRGSHEGEDADEHNGEIAIRSLYRSTPGIALGVGPFGVRIVPEADLTITTATEA